MRPILSPSILSFDPASFREPVLEVLAAGPDWLHLDVMDGQFVPPITFGADLARSLRGLSSIPFEAHLMTATPERHWREFVQAGCRRVTFHAEATSHSHRLAQQIREEGFEAGVAINPGTPVEALYPLVEVVDLALVMTVNPGWGGQKLIPECLRKVEALRKFAPDLDIEVDGGVSPETIRSLWDAGANVFVTGSFVASHPDRAAALEELRAACA